MYAPTFRVTIDCDNAAFDNDGCFNGHELARILRELADGLDNANVQPDDIGDDPLPLRDVNGNVVGQAAFDPM